MTTRLDRMPPLSERIVGADLIATGTVVGLRDIRPAEGLEPPRVSGLFEVDLDEVLRGDRAHGTALVRVLGEGRDERAVWVVPLQEGQRILLLLARDTAPDLPKDVFAPYFESSFPVEDGRVRVPEDALDELTMEVAGAERGVVPLDGLRRLVEVVGARREEWLRELQALLPAELRDQPYPEVEERPDVREGRPLPPETPLEPPPEGGRPSELKPDA